MDKKKSYSTEVARLAIPAAILAIAVIGFVALGSKPAVPTRPPKDSSVPQVTTIAVEKHDKGLDIEVEGYVVPHREINLAAEVPGRIRSKAEVCRAGKYVTEGTKLIEIDPKDYQSEKTIREQELEQAKANLGELRTEIANTKGLMKLALDTVKLQQNELKRLDDLPNNYVTDSQLDQERRNVLTARNAYETLNSQLNVSGSRRSGLESAKLAAEERLKKAQLDLDRTTITAPIDGVIVHEEVEQDSYVNKGTPLLTIEDTSAVEVRCSLRMDELYWLWRQAFAKKKQSSDGDQQAANVPRKDYEIPKTPVTVVYSLGDHEFFWDGELARYEGIGLDESTRTVPCRVLVKDPRKVRVVSRDARPVSKDVKAFLAQGPPALVRGMYVTVQIHATPNAPLFSIPEGAVRPGGQVWRVRDNKLDIVDARVVDVSGKVAVVWTESGDLKVGDRLVVSPLSFVRDGMDVRLAESERPENKSEERTGQ